jgi:FlaA1/EpsC-like NDP-sugar epimerase
MRLMAAYQPEVVFHAAAHKHVPLMEHCPQEAVRNNVFGTLNLVRAADAYGVKKFIQISTDKAVNPTNVMGASKRLCEMIVQSMAHCSKTTFAAVRFGNVLGSNGSVIPLFKRQIAAGGPITLTDFRIIRYFMTIPEAAQLVLEAGAMAHQNELFVLDMGRPVRILDLAENLIRLSGLEPYSDIAIVETGLRPGEKLYEELLVASRDIEKTASEKIFVEHQPPITPAELEGKLEVLKAALETEDADTLRAALHRVVPTFREPEEVNAAQGATVTIPPQAAAQEDIPAPLASAGA